MLVHFFAAARAAAACSTYEVPEQVVASAVSLADVVDHLGSVFTGSTPAGMPFVQVLEQCSFLVDGVASALDVPVAGAARLDVLPPFAGG